MELNNTMTVYTVEEKIPLITHSSTAVLLNVLQYLSNKKYSTGSTLRMTPTYFPQQKNRYLEYLCVHPPINDKALIKKLNYTCYTLLFMRFYIYSCKLHSKSTTLSDFVNQLSVKYHLTKMKIHSSTLLLHRCFCAFFSVFSVHFWNN